MNSCDASLKGRIRVEPGEASERVQARSRPTERRFFGENARSDAEKFSRSEQVATEERGTGARLAGAPEARGGNALSEGSLTIDQSLLRAPLKTQALRQTCAFRPCLRCWNLEIALLFLRPQRLGRNKNRLRLA